IKLGKITASTILRRLGTYSRKNKLYCDFQLIRRLNVLQIKAMARMIPANSTTELL
ncbi:transposase, partial [Xanthomonas campestris pv. convolvuli]|nr:transposase [Xanthomonas campestris pv. convolvuli]